MIENVKFTKREIEVLKLLIIGLSNSEIAKKLHISTHTVKAHITSMYVKTGVHSRIVLVVMALKSEQFLKKLRN